MYSKFLKPLTIVAVLLLVFLVAASQGPSLTLHVYRDSISLSGSIIGEYKGDTWSELILSLDINRGSFNGSLRYTGDLKETASPELRGNLTLSITPTSSGAVASLSGGLEAWSGSDRLVIALGNTSISFDKARSETRVTGEAVLEASGNMTQALLYLPLVESWLRGQSALGVSINRFTTTLEGSRATIVFDIVANNTRLAESLNVTSDLNLNATTPPVTLEVRIEATNRLLLEAVFSVGGDVNTYLGDVARVIEALSNSTGSPTMEIPGLGRIDLSRVLTVLREVEFKPSHASLNVTSDPATRRLIIGFETPRFIRRNSTIEDTIKWLYNTATTVVASEKLGDARVGITREQGVKTLLNNTPVDEVEFNQLPMLKVVVEEPWTQLVTQLEVIGVAAAVAVAGALVYMLMRRR